MSFETEYGKITLTQSDETDDVSVEVETQSMGHCFVIPKEDLITFVESYAK